ncbi:titin-like isoform X2 [Culex pipiens pallens]|uniref:titin-like isoform X2 n=1 Tax=Culex pipiens pallens TaxID=42434 RepID=UPI0022AA8272|nr:titin-like isoform X2 [Culex pipiens pallens]
MAPTNSQPDEVKSANEWFREIKQSEKSPIRLSDIDNLLQESIFESSDGAKLVEYLKKKRGGGRVRLQNIFQQVPVQRAQFNFNLDSSEPTPLPESPQPTTSNEDIVTEVIDNGDVQEVVVDPAVEENGSGVTPRVPIVIVNDLNTAKKATVKQIVLKSPGPMNTLSRQLLINQYQRTNAAKCELLKQLASSTPKPESNGSMGRMSTFTTSISPITEGDRSPLTPLEVIPSSQPMPIPAPMHVMEIVIPPAASQEVLVPCSQPVLAPCSQAVPDATPKKVVVLKTVVEQEEMVIPETPSPVQVQTESPKAPPNPNHMQPRRLSTTFKAMENVEEVSYVNGHITSDESEEEEDDGKGDSGCNSVLLKSILKDTSMGRSRHSMRVSFSKQLVQQREISPAPDIPEADDYNDSNSSEDSDLSESEDGEDNDFQVVDEVYTDDDDTEDAANLDHYEELKSRICELNNSHNGRRSVSPLIDVVKETPVQWFETTTPTKRRDQQAEEEQQFPPPTTAKKDNKTNLNLVDIITDWDDEEDEEEADHGAGNPEVEPSQEFAPEPRASLNSNHHDTNLDTMDISSSNLEDSVERLVELPPAPNALIEEEGVLPEEHIYPAAVDEQMPITTEELLEVLSGTEPEEESLPEPRPKTPEPVEEQPVDLPPPPTTPAEEPQSPERVITPPVQFTASAKRRFIQKNEDDLISRIQSDLPLSQASSAAEADTSTRSVEEPLKSFEKVSETLVEIAQSFRDQPPATQPPAPIDDTSRKLVQPPKRGGKKSNVDPVTASYFEAIEKTFAKPKAPPPPQQSTKTSSTQPKKTEQQKRKLYDATLSEVTEDDESMKGVAAKAPQAAVKVVEAAPKAVPKVRDFKIVVEMLRVEDYLPKKKVDVPSVAKELESEGVVAEPAVVQKAPAARGRRASRDKQPPAVVVAAKLNDSGKRPRGRPKKVRTESVGEQPAEDRPAEKGVVVEEPTQEEVSSKKKPKLRPNLGGDAPEQRPDEGLPSGDLAVKEVDKVTDKAPVVDKKNKKTKSKPNLVEDAPEQRPDEGLPNGDLAVEEADKVTDKDPVADKKNKKTKSKPKLVGDAPEQHPDEGLSNGDLAVEQLGSREEKDPVVDKKKKKTKLKPNLGGDAPEHRPDEDLPDGDLAVKEVDTVKDKDPVVDKKKKTKSKPNQREEEQRPDEGPPSGSLVEAQEPPKDKPQEKKKKPKPKLVEDSQQQRLDESSPNGTPMEVEEQEAHKVEKIVEKKKRSKPTQPEAVESLPAAVNGESVTDVAEKEVRKDKPQVQKKQKVKPTQRDADANVDSVTNEVEQDDTRKDEPQAQKKKAKPAQREADANVDSAVNVVGEESVEKDKPVAQKKKKLKPTQPEADESLLDANVDAVTKEVDKPEVQPKQVEPTQREAVESLPTAVNGKSVTDEAEKEVRKDKPQVQKKKVKATPRDADANVESVTNVVQQDDTRKDDPQAQKKQLEAESTPVVNGELVADVAEQEIPKDKPVAQKKKKLKPNLAAVAPPEQPPAEPTVQQSSEEVVVKKKKLRPNFGTKSKQQHVEVAAPAVDDDGESRLNEEEPVKQKKKQSRKSLDGKPVEQPKAVEPEVQLKEFQVKVAKMAVTPAAVSMSPASKAILQREKSGVEPSPSAARKLFDEPEVQEVTKKSRKTEKQQRANEDLRHHKRKEAKRAKVTVNDPIPKVRISAEKDGIYRITTPGREVDPAQESFVERLNVTESDAGVSVRTSLEDCPDEFLGFEDGEDTVADITIDLSRSNMELIIPLEKAIIPKGVKTPPGFRRSRKPQRQPRSPAATKSKKSREPKPPRRISGSTSEPAPQATSPERPAAATGQQLDNRSLPLKKRKSRDSSQEYLPSAPEEGEPSSPPPVFAVPAPVDLNNSLLIPVLQRVPIADKYLVRSTPDRGTDSTTEYDTDDTCATGDNVLIVRKDTSRLDQSRLSIPEEEEEEQPEVAGSDGKRIKNRRSSIALPRFYGDNTFDITWKPRQKSSGGSRKNKRRHDNDSGIEEEDNGVVRRSKRTCRISKQILMTNPMIKSAYDRPNYRPMSVEQLMEAEKLAKKLKQEERAKRQYRKPPGRPRKPSQSPRGRKRIQERTETQEDQQQAKRNRIEEATALPDVQPSTSSAATSSSSSGTEPGVAEVAAQVDEEAATVAQERLQAQSWMMKLMAENSGREEVMPQATSSGDRMHFQLDHLTFQERNGIQYSFFIYSETENFGFLRFAPAAVKKWTKTADFLLKFLVLHGQLSFQINGKETVTKGGDFLMLPQNTRYRIQNSDEISLVFMIKFRAAANELPSM